VVDGLEEMGQSLDRFGEVAIDTFAAFLRRAEEYDRTGIVPVVLKPPPKRTAKAKESGPPYTVDDALRDVRALYDRSLGDDVTYAIIEAELKKLDKLSKADAVQVAVGFGVGKHSAKKTALAAIRQKIDDYKKSHQRTQF
jgi:hypothetical protein